MVGWGKSIIGSASSLVLAVLAFLAGLNPYVATLLWLLLTFVVIIVMGFIAHRAGKSATRQSVTDAPKEHHVVTSKNQSGGITAHTVTQEDKDDG
jgi:hypothetical protein